MTTVDFMDGEDLIWIEDHPMVGQRVFTNRSPGVVLAVSSDGSRYRVDCNGVERDVSANSCSTKAVDSSYRPRYSVDRSNRTVTGRPSIGVKDELTEKLKGVDSALLLCVAEQNGIDASRYAHLNPGMQRMTIGNILRGRLRRNQAIVILDEALTPQEFKEAS